MSIGLVTIVTSLTLISLSFLYMTMNSFLSSRSTELVNSLPDRVFGFFGFLTWLFLLRESLLNFLHNDHTIYAVLALALSGVLGWNIRKLQYGRINLFLLILCLSSFSSGLFSILQAKPWESSSPITPPPDHNLYNQITFKKKPNVYYIIPDGYPNRQALETIYNMDNTNFYRQLDDAGFSVTHAVYSNYINTLSSVTSLLGMGHHFYNSSIGPSEMLGGRELIAGKRNPTTSIFQRNGYQVHHLHQNDYLLLKGCFVDSCSPSVSWEQAMEILIPFRLKAKLGFVTDRTLASFKARMFHHIKQVSNDNQPSFTFAHFPLPSHSDLKKQNLQDLASFRQEQKKRIQDSNELMLSFIQAINAKDPNALIIFNSDHGSFGLGWYGFANNEVFTGIAQELTILDHMGVLLAIRWPTPPPKDRISTNVNLFRTLFAYLSEDRTILQTAVPNDSYLRMGSKEIFKVVQDGTILKEPIPYQ